MAFTPIQNPTYIDSTAWPYIKGPNYTRPVFREHMRGGNFVAQPIVRMPNLSGLGEIAIPSACWDTPGFKDAHNACLSASQKKCNLEEPCTTQEHQACLMRLLATSSCAKAAPSGGSQTAWYEQKIVGIPLWQLAAGAAIATFLWKASREASEGYPGPWHADEDPDAMPGSDW